MQLFQVCNRTIAQFLKQMRSITRKIQTKNYSFNKKYHSSYSNKVKWRIILPEEVFIKFEDSLNNNEPNFKFYFEIGLYYLSLISSIPSYKKDKTYPGGYVNLDSRILKKVDCNYSRYLRYLEENGLIECNPKYSNRDGRKFCKSYRYNLTGIKKLNFKVFELDVLKKIMEKLNLKDKTVCTNPKYLVKWLNENLTIDSVEALEEIQISLTHTPTQELITLKKAENYLRSLKNIHFKEFWASRDSKKDNRLHHNLTNMAKILRKWIRYNGESLVGLDIKNSQPFFLIMMIECLINRKKNYSKRIYKLIRKRCDEIGLCGTMWLKITQLIDNELFIKEFSEIKRKILDGQFYEHLCDNFEFPPTMEGIYIRRFYCKDSSKTKPFHFETKRDLVKRLVLFFLYKSNKHDKQDDKDYITFKELYPKFCQLLELLKEKDKTHLPNLLQHIEADCIIDYVCKKISIDNPNLPLFPIHDSIATVGSMFPILEREMKLHMQEYCLGIMPTLKQEDWCPECEIRASA